MSHHLLIPQEHTPWPFVRGRQAGAGVLWESKKSLSASFNQVGFISETDQPSLMTQMPCILWGSWRVYKNSTCSALDCDGISPTLELEKIDIFPILKPKEPGYHSTILSSYLGKTAGRLVLNKVQWKFDHHMNTSMDSLGACTHMSSSGYSSQCELYPEKGMCVHAMPTIGLVY